MPSRKGRWLFGATRIDGYQPLADAVEFACTDLQVRLFSFRRLGLLTVVAGRCRPGVDYGW